jgi:dihydroxyacetone kinase
MVVVADDVALSANGDHAGRRGLAGTVLVHKIAGAAAAGGASLAQVAQAARDAAAALGTMGVALTPCTVPAAGKPGFTLGEGEIEWGLGIHGEAGVERGRLVPAGDAVARLLRQIIGDLKLQAGARVALLVNNLGGTPASELDIVAGAALAFLARQGIVVERAWAGTFLSALEMAGISLTLLRVDDARLALLDAATQAPAWPASGGRIAAARAVPPAPSAPAIDHGARLSAEAPLRRAIDAVCACLQASEALLTDMDQKVGDGDLGISMARAAQGIREDIDRWPSEQDPAAVLRAMSATVRRVVGGTSGPLYAILLMRGAAALEQRGRGDAAAWSAAFAEAVKGVMELGGAKAGDRTMIDALLPAADALQAALSTHQDSAAALAAAAAAAEQGAAATASMTPRRGRSSYIGQRAIGHADPGAHAVALWLAALRDALKS